MTAVIFAGPTITPADIAPADIAPADIAPVLDAVILPPARQGDVLRALRDHRPRAIGLIDGVFRDAPSVWHRELLWALHQGVHVFGAASMGALRAAELHGFGMRGIGAIFAAYRDGNWPGDPAPFDDDDEVAVIHAPAAAAHRPLSDAMVDIRASLDACVARALLPAATAARLATAQKALHFPDRSLAATAAAAAEAGHPEAAHLLRHAPIRLKRTDAMQMVAAMAAFLAADPAPHVPAFAFQPALVWEAALDRFADEPATDAEAAAIAALRANPDAWREAALAALGRRHAEADAAPPGASRALLDRLRARHALAFRADLDAFAARQGLDTAGLAALLAREARIDAGIDAARGLTPSILDALRLAGRLAAP
jgi:hypothetical protein